MRPPQPSDPEYAGLPLDPGPAASLPRPGGKGRRRSRRGRPADDAQASSADEQWWQAQVVRVSTVVAVWLGY